MDDRQTMNRIRMLIAAFDEFSHHAILMDDTILMHRVDEMETQVLKSIARLCDDHFAVVLGEPEPWKSDDTFCGCQCEGSNCKHSEFDVLGGRCAHCGHKLVLIKDADPELEHLLEHDQPMDGCTICEANHNMEHAMKNRVNINCNFCMNAGK